MLHSLFISRTLLAFQFNFHELNIVYAAYTAFSSVHKSIDLRSKSMDWFLYNNGLRHERVNWILTHYSRVLLFLYPLKTLENLKVFCFQGI